jgi:hypothetical protein
MGVVEVKLATSSKASLGERIGQRLLDTERESSSTGLSDHQFKTIRGLIRHHHPVHP